MTNGAGAKIDIVICNDDLLAGVVKFRKSAELSLVSLLFSNRVGYLDVVLLITFPGNEVYFMGPVVINLKAVAHIY